MIIFSTFVQPEKAPLSIFFVQSPTVIAVTCFEVPVITLIEVPLFVIADVIVSADEEEQDLVYAEPPLCSLLNANG